MVMEDKYRDFRFFYEPSDFSKENLIVADAMGNIDSTTFCIDRDYFDNQLFVYVLEGKFHLEQYGKKYILEKGDTVVLQLRHRQKYYCDPETGASIIWFHFRGKEADRIMEKLYQDGLLPLVSYNPSMEYHVYDCFDIAEKRNMDFELAMSAKIYNILLKSAGKCWLKIDEQEDSASFRQKTAQYIEKNITAQIDLETLAANVNLSKYYFCRQFKQEFGCTAFAYIREKKIRTAKQFLIFTDDSLSQIAEKLGYTDQAHFSKQFKEHTGISPLKFRKNSGM